MNPAKHAVVKTQEGYRVVRILLQSATGMEIFAFAEEMAFPTPHGAAARAELLEDLATTETAPPERTDWAPMTERELFRAYGIV